MGKIQLASALRVRFDDLGEEDRKAAVELLGRFAEPRYLHQTTTRSGGRKVAFFDDLAGALDSHAGSLPDGEWRVHFHVPLFADSFGQVESTMDQVLRVLELAGSGSSVRHFEAETYAWDVLPTEFKCEELADGIAKELTWILERKATQPAA